MAPDTYFYRENKALAAALELANNRDGMYGTEKLDLTSQITKLKAELEHVSKAVADSNLEAKRAKEESKVLYERMVDIEALERAKKELTQEKLDLNAKNEKLENELSVLCQERDSLAAMVKQKDSLLFLQSQQSEASIKMLQQRQAALERVGTQMNHSSEDWARLQESLRGLFTKEGKVIQSEMMDAEKMIDMIKDLREKMSLYEQLIAQLEAERVIRKELEGKLFRQEQMAHALDQVNQEINSKLTDTHKELEEVKAKLAKSEESVKALNPQSTNIPYSNGPHPRYPPNLSNLATPFYIPSVASMDAYGGMNMNPHDAGGMNQSAEAAFLRGQLEASQREAAAAKEELKIAQNNMQREFASLWMSVQELNKLDALKDKSIQDLINDRALLTQERDTAMQRLKAVLEENDSLKKELQVLVPLDRLPKHIFYANF